MCISRIVGDKLVVLASESFQVFTCLTYLLLVSVETNNPRLILRQLAEVRHLARGRAVKVYNDLARLRIQNLAGDHSGEGLQMDQASLAPGCFSHVGEQESAVQNFPGDTLRAPQEPGLRQPSYASTA